MEENIKYDPNEIDDFLRVAPDYAAHYESDHSGESSRSKKARDAAVQKTTKLIDVKLLNAISKKYKEANE